MRLFSYLFHGVLALFLLALGLVPLFSGTHNLRLNMLPWEGKALTFWLLGLALLGLVSVLLAIAGKARAPLFAWSLLVVVMMLWGYFWRPYRWSSADAFQTTLLLVGGALLATLGAWFALKRRPARRRNAIGTPL
jgi:LPXTG-motif cell wall-anchored protein